MGAFATFVVFAWRDRDEYVIPADEVARIDRANRSARAAALAQHAGRAMSGVRATAGHGDPDRIGTARRQPGMPHGGPASKRIVVGYGFWIFLLSDIVMFSAFFAAYAVLSDETAGGPSGRDLFDLRNVAIETACLLLSSFTCGVASIGARGAQRVLVLWRHGGDLRARRGVPRCSSCASSPAWSRAAPARRAAPSCPPSSRWSAATACT